MRQCSPCISVRDRHGRGRVWGVAVFGAWPCLGCGRGRGDGALTVRTEEAVTAGLGLPARVHDAPPLLVLTRNGPGHHAPTTLLVTLRPRAPVYTRERSIIITTVVVIINIINSIIIIVIVIINNLFTCIR